MSAGQRSEAVAAAAEGTGRRTRPIRVLALMESESITGPAKNLIAVGRELAQAGTAGAAIRVATFMRRAGGNAFTAACGEAGLPVDIVRERRAFDPAVIPQLRAVVERYRPDIVQSHHIKSHLLVRVCGLNRHAPWIAFNHGYTAENAKMKLYNQLDRWSLRAADRVVVVCEAFARDLKRRGIAGERLVVRHNAVSEMPRVRPEAVGELRGKLKIPPAARVVLTVGRLSAEKAQAVVLRAAAAMKNLGVPEFRLVIVGDGPERERLRGLCAALGIEDVVIWAGTTQDVVAYYALADVFVLPSHSEGSPNALLEAMMAGLPVVATAVGGVPEIVDSGTRGLLVPAGDAGAIAEAAAGLLEDEERRNDLGMAARAWVKRHYSREAYTGSILELYERTLAAHARK